MIALVGRIELGEFGDKTDIILDGLSAQSRMFYSKCSEKSLHDFTADNYSPSKETELVLCVDVDDICGFTAIFHVVVVKTSVIRICSYLFEA